MGKIKKLPEMQLNEFYPFNLAAGLFCEETEIYIPGIQAAVETLTEREQKVIYCRYRDRMTLQEVGWQHNVTTERVRQIEAKALRKLRHPTKKALYLAIPASELRLVQGKYDKLARGYEQLKEAYAAATAGDTECVESPKIEKVLLSKKPLEELDLSVRTYSCLRRVGISTLGQICDMTTGNLLKVRNLGRKSAQEVIAKLAEYGLTLEGYTTLEQAIAEVAP